jgi:acetyl-CoA carboxylase biotin carboxyl carrier protein
MKRMPVDGRLFTPELVARARAEGEQVVVTSPAVGLWRDAPAPGTVVTPGANLGELEILGVLHRLRAPEQAVGVVLVRPGPRLARQPVAYDDVLVRLDPSAGVAAPAAGGAAPTAAAAGREDEGTYFRSPLSGRYYGQPGPGQPPFVKAGDVIVTGQAVALLEVMKTFNRLAYGGEGLPARARVTAVLVADESDVDEGAPLLWVEPA